MWLYSMHEKMQTNYNYNRDIDISIKTSCMSISIDCISYLHGTNLTSIFLGSIFNFRGQQQAVIWDSKNEIINNTFIF